MAGSVAILARHHQAMPITKIRVAGTILGETADGVVVVPAAVDYVSWTERVASFAARPDLAGAQPPRLWIAGKLSPHTRQELLARQWTIEEGVSVVPPTSPARITNGTAPRSARIAEKGKEPPRRQENRVCPDRGE
jgi:hypothetical protein